MVNNYITCKRLPEVPKPQYFSWFLVSSVDKYVIHPDTSTLFTLFNMTEFPENKLACYTCTSLHRG